MPPLRPFHLDGVFARFDLSFSFAERDAELTVSIDYRTELYTDATIEKLVARLLRVLSTGDHREVCAACRPPRACRRRAK